MFLSIHPKLPMREKAVTHDYYVNQLGFEKMAYTAYPDYLMLTKDGIEIHFFLFRELDPLQNYGQVYIRTNNIQQLYAQYLQKGVAIHPNAPLTLKPWGLFEFSLLDPDHNLITFGQSEEVDV